MERRDFIKICAATAAAGVRPVWGAGDLRLRFYARALLVDEHRRPLKTASLATGRNYIFHYPFETTPCFLLNLGRPTLQRVTLRTTDGNSYELARGVGPNHAIVGYPAICTHRMAYPTRQISFISYRDSPGAGGTSRPNMIHCCSEHSEYDPASGARVVGGPAPQPLPGQKPGWRAEHRDRAGKFLQTAGQVLTIWRNV